jgi:hypothetical protein
MRHLLALIATASIINPPCYAAPLSSINGVWESSTNDSNFTLRILLSKGKIVGTFCSVMRSGSKIDCPTSDSEENITGTYDGTTAHLNLKGSFDPSAKGRATFNQTSGGEANWNLTDYQGEMFVPNHTKVIRNSSIEIIASERAPIYKTPNTSSPTSAYFIKGDAVTAIERRPDGWIRIRYGKQSIKTGWLPKDSYSTK